MALGKLTARTVETIKKAGRHSDGGGLYLHVKATGAKSWTFISVANGKRKEIGLGPLASVPLIEARRKAQEAREAIARGDDPLVVLRPQEAAAIPLFGKFADDWICELESGWRNPKHRDQWRVTLGTVPYNLAKVRIDKKAHAAHVKALTALRAMPVDQIQTADILAVLRPIWLATPETASRLRGRLEAVLDGAKAKNHRTGDNPAAWRGNLKSLLPKRDANSRGHHAAMNFEKLPEFMARLRARDSVTARCLEFLILTAARSGEALGARWDEIDFGEKVWTIPEHRMKAKTEHDVPLSERAVAIVKALNETRVSEYVFPGRGKQPLSSMAMAMLLRDLEPDVTVHGFRSAFRDWCGDKTNFPRDVAEMALAHQVGDKTERAYRRKNAIEKRRLMMQQWQNWCDGKPAAKVIELSRRRKA
jgi:integrase